VKKLARSIFISIVAFYLVVQFIPGIGFGGKMENLLLASFVYALLATVVRPILKTLLLPFNLITFGALGAVINLGIVFVLSFLLPFFTFGAFSFTGADVLGFVIPAFNSSPFFTASVLSVGVSFLSGLLYYLLT
jgi:uncharacterized membrane protein YvlD (DUF360 family)